jgi:hypothetical protein
MYPLVTLKTLCITGISPGRLWDPKEIDSRTISYLFSQLLQSCPSLEEFVYSRGPEEKSRKFQQSALPVLTHDEPLDNRTLKRMTFGYFNVDDGVLSSMSTLLLEHLEFTRCIVNTNAIQVHVPEAVYEPFKQAYNSTHATFFQLRNVYSDFKQIV